jgi:hypothetical protein
MQNYYVKELETIFTVQTENTGKKLKVVYNVSSIYFQNLRYNMRHCIFCWYKQS